MPRKKTSSTENNFASYSYPQLHNPYHIVTQHQSITRQVQGPYSSLASNNSNTTRNPNKSRSGNSLKTLNSNRNNNNNNNVLHSVNSSSDGNGFHVKPKVMKDNMAKRNERERNRVKMVNGAFETLRQKIPWAENNPKMSKVDTLRAALDYIKLMQNILDECDSQSVNPHLKHTKFLSSQIL